MWQRFMIDANEEAYGARPFCTRDCAIRFVPDPNYAFERLSVALETDGNEFPDGVQCETCGKAL